MHCAGFVNFLWLFSIFRVGCRLSFFIQYHRFLQVCWPSAPYWVSSTGQPPSTIHRGNKNQSAVELKRQVHTIPAFQLSNSSFIFFPFQIFLTTKSSAKRVFYATFGRMVFFYLDEQYSIWNRRREKSRWEKSHFNIKRIKGSWIKNCTYLLQHSNLFL